MSNVTPIETARARRKAKNGPSRPSPDLDPSRGVRQSWRWNLIVFPRFQYTLIGTNLALMLAASAIAYFATSQSFSDLSPASGLSGMESEVFKRFLEYQAAGARKVLLLCMVGQLVLSTIVTLIVSHRFAGPLVRLKNYFLGIAHGNPVTHLSFRDGDFFSEIPPVVNSALDALTEKQRRAG